MLVSVAEAVKSRCPSFENRVTVSAAFQVLEDAGKLTLPAAYVVLMDDEAGTNQSDNGYQQLVSDTFAVVVVLSNAVDELGKATIGQILPYRKELCKALLSWKPDAEHGPIVYEGGQLLAIDRGHVYYQYEFSAETEFTEADTYQATHNAALPELQSVHINIDTINPHDPNLAATGPDGRVEVAAQIEIQQ